ncbi:MAG: TonB-dependent receptor [Acidobacteria bacterium]|nr:TonB-dependent receptor [Acidobacteriota bacterium]
MRRPGRVAFTAVILAVAIGAAGAAASAQPAGRGTITGRIRLAGALPGNPVIRMGADPLCSKINAGKRVIQEAVLTSADGGLANVFIKLDGSFPQSPAPAAPATIDQRGCTYGPRVVGVRVGQMLAVRNSDALLHNVHGVSARGNGFNVSEPKAGMVQTFRMMSEETMLRLRCDVHTWMTAYIGVVSHPYFAVSSATGAFELGGVPAGTYTIRTWHERYGLLTQTVRVRAGAATAVAFAYTGNEKPPTSGVRDLQVPAPAVHMAAR